MIAPPRAPLLLTTLERKAELVAGLGVEELVVVPFDAAFAALTADEFVDGVLVERLARDARDRGGELPLRPRRGGRRRAPARPTGASRPGSRRCSRSTARSCPRATSAGSSSGGAVEYADELLGAPFTLTREVVHGDKRGRELGFPTANLLPADGYVTPGPRGVRVPRDDASGETYAAATNVGVRPMFVTGRGELIEAFLLDFDADIYGQPLRLEFLKRLRGEKRFESVEALVEQMARDVDEARAIAG